MRLLRCSSYLVVLEFLTRHPAVAGAPHEEGFINYLIGDMLQGYYADCHLAQLPHRIGKSLPSALQPERLSTSLSCIRQAIHHHCLLQSYSSYIVLGIRAEKARRCAPPWHRRQALNMCLCEFHPHVPPCGQRYTKKAWSLYSPHLLAVRERIKINSEPLPEASFAKYFFQVWDALEELGR